MNFTDPLGLQKDDNDDCGVDETNCADVWGPLRGAGTGSGSGGSGFGGTPAVMLPGEFVGSPHAAICGNDDCSEAIVTAPTSNKPWLFNGRAYVRNPHWVKSPWSKTFDITVSVMFAGPGIIALGGELVALGALVPIGEAALSNTKMAAITGWGRGRAEALARIAQVNRAQVAAMRAQGLTKGDVMHWSRVYMRGIQLERGVGVAGARYSLMQKILQNW